MEHNLNTPLSNEQKRMWNYALKKAKDSVAPIFFGSLDSDPPFTRNATVTFVRTKERCFGITNYHVVHHALTTTKNARAYCTVYNTRIFPESSMIDADSHRDLATLAIDPRILDKHNIIPFVWPTRPAQPPRAGDTIVMVGYPGKLRSWKTRTNLELPHIGNVLQATTVHDAKFVIQFPAPDEWIFLPGTVNADHLTDYGGISGSGAYMYRPQGVGITIDLVGVAKEFSGTLGLLECTRTDCLKPDGKITP